MKEKVYITRDQLSDNVWVWRRPDKGEFIPTKLENCDVVCWMRDNLDNCSCYLDKDFKKKFNFSLKKKEKLCIHIDEKLLDSPDYQMFSMDSKRKR